MLNTQGFQIVAEITEAKLLEMIGAAWKSGGDDSSVGVIPEKIPLPAGLLVEPYILETGFVQIPQESLELTLQPDRQQIDLGMRVDVQLVIENPPVESASKFDFSLAVSVPLQLDSREGSHNICMLFTDLTDDDFSVELTSGNPLDQLLENGLEELIHQLYRSGVIPSIIDIEESILIEAEGVELGSTSLEIQLFDDPADPERQISVEYLDEGGRMQIDIPVKIRFYEIKDKGFGDLSLESPMAVLSTVRILADHVETVDSLIAALPTAEVQLLEVLPAAGEEGANYVLNRLALQPYTLLEVEIRNAFAAEVDEFLAGLEPANIGLPTTDRFEELIVQALRTELAELREFVCIWEKENIDEEFFPNGISVVTRIMEGALAIGIAFDDDPDDIHPELLENFIPPDCDFAIGLDGEFFIETVTNVLNEEFDDLPVRLPEDQTDGWNVDLSSIDEVRLVDGALRIRGKVTVIDAVLGSIDVDAEFEQDFDFRWVDVINGGQILEPVPQGDPRILDLDLSVFGWIAAILTGVLTFGVLGGVFAAGLVAIALALGKALGGSALGDDIEEEIQGVHAWPAYLQHIGPVSTIFKEQIDIFESGIIVRGTMTVTSEHEDTTIDFADSHGPYLFSAGNPLPFDGGSALPESTAEWSFGDGNTSADRNPEHTYGDSGLYISRLQVHVNQDGGATTRHFAAVSLLNQPSTVELGPHFTVVEGEPFEITGSFRDIEWLDTHTARFDFGDNSRPVDAEISETNEPPEAVGTASASHTYCDNGLYTIRLTVKDDDGGIGEATTTVEVINVPPEVTAAPELNVLVGQHVNLSATFSDPGWCDQHTAFWDLGDCHFRNAFVEETNTPPAAVGTAQVCHTYQHCGRYLATVTVWDDDGENGQANTVVNAVRLKNPSMDDGFYLESRNSKGVAQVANDWCPYYSRVLTIDPRAVNAPSSVVFAAGHVIYKPSGQSQRVDFEGAVQAGIYQQIPVNRGWCYEFSGLYNLPLDGSGYARIGIDPLGGTDPSSESIEWVSGPAGKDWQPLTVRVIAAASKISLFIGGVNYRPGDNTIYWDSTSLCMVQPPQKQVSNDCLVSSLGFDHLRDEETPIGEISLPPVRIIIDEGLMRKTLIGNPVGQAKLLLERASIRIVFPWPISKLNLKMSALTETEVQLSLFAGEVLLEEYTENLTEAQKLFAFEQAGMTLIEIISRGRVLIVDTAYCPE